MRAAVASLTLCAALLAAGTARAQSVVCNGAGDFPCGNQIENAQIQRAPTLLKFQARVSQAKLPIADGVFRKILVALKSGSETLCTEEFRDVRITQSTVNLEVGRNVDCELDRVVAENRELAFQVCIGGMQNCLRPIEVGATPYSIKSTYSLLAQQAHVSDIAGQADYMHRASADRDMLFRKEYGTGYFDFGTPASAPGLYSNPADFAPFANGGFLTWTPMHESAPTMHIAARDAARDTPTPLGKLLLESNSTETLGRLIVKANGLQVNGASSIDGSTTVFGMLDVKAPADGSPSGLAVQGPGRFTGTLSVGGATTVGSGGIHVTGDSDIDGNVSVTGALTSTGLLTVRAGGASIGGDMTLGGNLNATGSLTTPSASFTGLIVGATGMTINGPLTVNGGVSFPGAAPVAGVPGDFNVPGTLTAAALEMSAAPTVPSLAASGNIGTSGKAPSSGYPSGWTGGVHTRDVLAEGSVGVGPSGGPARASIDSSTVRAQNVNLTGNLQVSTINGKAPGGGLRFYWSANCRIQGSGSCSCDSGDTAITYQAGVADYNFFLGPSRQCGTGSWCFKGGSIDTGQYDRGFWAKVGCLSGLW